MWMLFFRVIPKYGILLWAMIKKWMLALQYPNLIHIYLSCTTSSSMLHVNNLSTEVCQLWFSISSNSLPPSVQQVTTTILTPQHNHLVQCVTTLVTSYCSWSAAIVQDCHDMCNPSLHSPSPAYCLISYMWNLIYRWKVLQRLWAVMWFQSIVCVPFGDVLSSSTIERCHTFAQARSRQGKMVWQRS